MKFPNLFQKTEKLTTYKGLAVRHVFTAGKPYYELVNAYEMPIKRFKFAQQYLRDMEMKIDKSSLAKFMQKIKDHCNKGEMVAAWKLADEVEYRTTWLFEPDTLYRLASVLYFDLKENISDYDIIYNNAKIEVFKKKGLLMTFVKLLVQFSESFQNLSQEDLQTYLEEQKKHIGRQRQQIAG